jgi:hypothetical protein
MARADLTIRQGTTGRFSIRWPAVDLTLYNVYFQVRKTFASTAELAAESPLIGLSIVNGVSTGDAIAYGDIVAGVRDSVSITIGADLTALLINQDYNAEKPSHKADVLLVLKTDAAKERIRIAEFNVLVEPRVTVLA